MESSMKRKSSKERFSDKARERYVAAWEQSSKTRVAFTEEIGISSKTLCLWIRKQRALLPEKLSVDILLHNGIQVHILSHHNTQKLLSMIKEL